MAILLGVVVAIGAIGSYAMSLSMIGGIKKEAGWPGVLALIFPGLVYIVAYSILGFVWGLMVWRMFSEGGPISSIVEDWRVDPGSALVGTVLTGSVWIFLAWLAVNW